MPARLKAPHKDRQLRQRIAEESARILAEWGSRQYQLAKRKAAEHLGVHDLRELPSNAEVEQALADYQRLFRSDTQPRHLYRLRQAALSAMKFLSPYTPKLVGAVLDGTADAHSEVNLHVFPDTAEELGLFLLDHEVPYELHERRVRSGPGEYRQLPDFRFLADQVPIALTVFSAAGGRAAPLSPVNGRPMTRAGRRELESLLVSPPDLETEG